MEGGNFERKKTEREKVEDAKRPCCMMGERDALIKKCQKSKKKKKYKWQRQVLVQVLASIPNADASSHTVIALKCAFGIFQSKVESGFVKGSNSLKLKIIEPKIKKELSKGIKKNVNK